ncbi:hypothetical protein DFH11DRAFT_1765462 [Phellopilus nigrolimitatus]|nr:hypothetical protein DFH11DRAFT_1765462 [Phellopilus nigrolimitatus]
MPRGLSLFKGGVLSRSVHPRSSANRTCDTNRTSGHLERPPNPLSFIPLDFVRLESSSFSSFGSNPLRLAGILSIRSESLVLRSSGLVASPFGSNCSSFVPQDSYDSDPLRSAGFLSVRFEPLVHRPSGLVRLGSPSFGGIPLGSVQTSRPSFLRTRTAWIPFVTPLRPAGTPFLRPESSPFGSALLRSAGIPSVRPEPSSFGLVILRPAGISSVRPEPSSFGLVLLRPNQSSRLRTPDYGLPVRRPRLTMNEPRDIRARDQRRTECQLQPIPRTRVERTAGRCRIQIQPRVSGIEDVTAFAEPHARLAYATRHSYRFTSDSTPRAERTTPQSNGEFLRLIELA